MGWTNLKLGIERSELKIFDWLCRTLLCCFLLSAMSFQPTMAQTWSEWFRQKKTQQKYLLEQVVALKMYAGHIQKGYQVAKSGLGTISDLADGEFNLHEVFISGLKKVNPVIKDSGKVGDVLELQLGISRAFRGLEVDGMLNAANRLYVASVREDLWQQCLGDLEELLLVITSGKLEMGDRERLERLDGVFLSMSEKNAFAQHFCSSVKMLIDQRRLELGELREMGGLYGF